jgi:hypothetical protein
MGSLGAGCISCSRDLVDACILETERSPYCFHRAGLVSQESFHAGRGAVDLSVWCRPHQYRSTAYAALTRAGQWPSLDIRPNFGCPCPSRILRRAGRHKPRSTSVRTQSQLKHAKAYFEDNDALETRKALKSIGSTENRSCDMGVLRYLCVLKPFG